MTAIRFFTEIIPWQRAHQLALDVYRETERLPKTETFGLTSQMRRCVVSIPSNLAEGFKRQGRGDSLRFYNIAEGSLEELKYQLLLSKDLGYIAKERHAELKVLADEVGRLINGWKRVQQ